MNLRIRGSKNPRILADVINESPLKNAQLGRLRNFSNTKMKNGVILSTVFADIICAWFPREVKDRMERENQERQREREELRAKMEREKGELEKQLEVGNKGLEEQGQCSSSARSNFGNGNSRGSINSKANRWRKAVGD